MLHEQAARLRPALPKPKMTQKPTTPAGKSRQGWQRQQRSYAMTFREWYVCFGAVIITLAFVNFDFSNLTTFLLFLALMGSYMLLHILPHRRRVRQSQRQELRMKPEGKPLRGLLWSMAATVLPSIGIALARSPFGSKHIGLLLGSVIAGGFVYWTGCNLISGTYTSKQGAYRRKDSPIRYWMHTALIAAATCLALLYWLNQIWVITR